MNITQHFLTENDCYKTGRTIVPKGVMVHSTGVAQPNVNAFLSSWNRSGFDACVHAFVGRDGVVQTLPWNRRGWHCYKGKNGSGNNTHISFEMCEPAGHTYQGGTMLGYDVAKNAGYFAAVYQNAVELTARLCKSFGLNPLADGVVICHSEGYRRGIAGNHADVMHWFPKHGKSMDSFRADVAQEMKGEVDMTVEEVKKLVAGEVAKALAEQDGDIQKMVEKELAQRDEVMAQQAKNVSPWAEAAWSKAKQNGVFDGTRPGGNLTREQGAVVFDRLGLLESGV